LPGKRLAGIKAISSVGDTPLNEITFCKLTGGDISEMLLKGDFKNLHITEVKEDDQKK